MKKEELLFGLVGIFFALMGLFFFLSQNASSQATDILLANIIDFEIKGSIDNKLIGTQALMNENSLGSVKELSRRNYVCSVITLYKLYGEQSEISQEMVQEGIDMCVKNFSLDYYIEQQGSLINLSYGLLNLSDSINPIINLPEDLEEVQKLHKKSELFETLGWGCLILGFLIFYYISLKYFFHRRRLNEQTNN